RQMPDQVDQSLSISHYDLLFAEKVIWRPGMPRLRAALLEPGELFRERPATESGLMPTPAPVSARPVRGLAGPCGGRVRCHRVAGAELPGVRPRPRPRLLGSGRARWLAALRGLVTKKRNYV